jgi:hypothetical protein
MDELDREIQEATRATRRRIWHRRRAWVAALATFFITAAISATVLYSAFPASSERELDQRERDRKARGETLDALGVADNYRAYSRDRNRGRWKVILVVGLSFGAALFVLNRLEPKDDPA